MVWYPSKKRGILKKHFNSLKVHNLFLSKSLTPKLEYRPLCSLTATLSHNDMQSLSSLRDLRPAAVRSGYVASLVPFGAAQSILMVEEQNYPWLSTTARTCMASIARSCSRARCSSHFEAVFGFFTIRRRRWVSKDLRLQVFCNVLELQSTV